MRGHENGVTLLGSRGFDDALVRRRRARQYGLTWNAGRLRCLGDRVEVMLTLLRELRLKGLDRTWPRASAAFVIKPLDRLDSMVRDDRGTKLLGEIDAVLDCADGDRRPIGGNQDTLEHRIHRKSSRSRILRQDSAVLVMMHWPWNVRRQRSAARSRFRVPQFHEHNQTRR